MILEFDTGLIEEAVFQATRSRETDAFHAERDSIYSIREPRHRERRFAELHDRWFRRLGLDRPLHAILAEQPHILRNVALCVIATARRSRDEGAELFVRNDDPLAAAPTQTRRLRLLVRPSSLLDTPTLIPFLRRELLHVADMLDPSFGYEPQIPRSQAGSTHDRLLLDRYAALWATTVVGRLVRDRKLPEESRQAAWRRFLAAFPIFDGDRAAAVFRRFFDGDRPAHSELVEFALSPREPEAGINTRPPGARCPLCSMPSYTFEVISEPEARARIARQFPAWQPEDGACLRCSELYRMETTDAITASRRLC